jgi:hypothetical protein
MKGLNDLVLGDEVAIWWRCSDRWSQKFVFYSGVALILSSVDGMDALQTIWLLIKRVFRAGADTHLVLWTKCTL